MVHERDRDELAAACTDCNRDLGLDPSRVYDSGNGARLCWECAVRRGGVFDASRDRWIASPDVADLPDERRPHP